MALKTKIKSTKNGISKIFVFDEINPKNSELVYDINASKKKIIFYPKKDKFFLKQIIIKGFDEVPDCFSTKGYIKSGTQYYLDKMMRCKKVIKLIISKDDSSSFKKFYSGFKVVINYGDFKLLKNRLGSIIYTSKKEKINIVDDFFYDIFPKRYKKSVVTPKQRINKVLSNLDVGIIEHLDRDGVDKILNFFELLLKTKYRSRIQKRKLFSATKIKVDDIAISDILKNFDDMLLKSSSESSWSDFIKRNLFLLDSKYIKAIPELNVMLAGARKVDFGLVDSQGYLDIFEIKLPKTQLLSKSKDRGNYYWSTNAIKALTQVEKYLYNAERKAPELSEDIKREKDFSVKIIKPRAIVIMGCSDQLKNNARKEDFRILRMSLKNIEIVLYDELINRLKNQKNKIYKMN